MNLSLLGNGMLIYHLSRFFLICIASNLICFVNTQVSLGTSYLCNRTFTESTGIINSINFPNSYSDGLDCNITLHIPKAIRIELIFDFFHTESESDLNLLNEMCVLDYLEIRDTTSTLRLCGYWGGKEHLLYFNFHTSILHLNFHTNEINVRTGYMLRWFTTQQNSEGQNISPCGTPLLDTEQSCYEVIDTPETWEKGHNICRTRGAVLAQIEDEDIHRALEKNLQLRNFSLNSFWIGANDRLFEGDYIWTDRTTVIFRNWFPGWLWFHDDNGHSTSQPSDDGFSNEDCVEIRRQFAYPGKGTGLTDSFFWNDRNCNVKNPFICQHEKELYKRTKRFAPLDCNGLYHLTEKNLSITVTSPGYPEDYPRLLSCHVIIRAPFGYQISFDFHYMHIEGINRYSNAADSTNQHMESCVYDNITLANFPATRPQRQVTFCGNWNKGKKLLRWTSDVNNALLTFQTDNTKQFTGFDVNISMTNKGSFCDFTGDSDWWYGPNGCWRYNNVTLNLTEAKAECEQIGGYLPNITNNLQFVGDLLNHLMPDMLCVDLWTHGHQNESENHNITDTTCYSTRICKIGSQSGIVQDYTSIKILVPCLHLLSFVCVRPIKEPVSSIVMKNFTTPSGDISSKCNYSNNADIIYTITADMGHRVLVEINGYDIEYQDDCLYDYLEVMGTVEDRRLCGRTRDNLTFISTNRNVTIQFSSDDDVIGCGYNISWRWVLKNQTFDVLKMSANSGLIKRLNYPFAFPDLISGCYNITASQDQRVIMEFSELNLPGNNCDDNMLQINNILNQSRSIFCGGSFIRNPSVQPVFLSNSNTLTVCLNSTALSLGEGFNASYTFVPKKFASFRRRIYLVPGTNITISSIMFPHGFPPRFTQIVELWTDVGHALSVNTLTLRRDLKRICNHNDKLDIYDISLTKHHNHTIYNTTCHHGNVSMTTVNDIPKSRLNALEFSLQSGDDNSELSSLQFEATVSSIQDLTLLEKTSTSEGMFLGCESDTCINGGQCSFVEEGRANCSCTPQYQGLFCQTSLCDLQPCSHGNCSLTSTGFRCQCKPYYWGDLCQWNTMMCRWKWCSTHGRCVAVNDTHTGCVCDPQWTGGRCETLIPIVPEQLTIGQKLLKEPIWIGMIVILNLVLFFCLSYLVRRKCGRKLIKFIPTTKKSTVSTTKEESRAETSVSSHYRETPVTLAPRLKITRTHHTDRTSTPSTPAVTEQNQEAALKMFESYRSDKTLPSSSHSLADIANKVMLKSQLTDFRASGITEGRVSFSDDQFGNSSDSSHGILRSYSISTGIQDLKTNRAKQIRKGGSCNLPLQSQLKIDIERNEISNETKPRLEDQKPTVHRFPEIKILNENSIEQERYSDSENSIVVYEQVPDGHIKDTLQEKKVELRSTENLDSGYPSTTVSSSTTNHAIVYDRDHVRPSHVSAVERRKMFSSKAKSSSFYDIAASESANRSYYSLPEKRKGHDLHLSIDQTSAVTGRYCTCFTSKYGNSRKYRYSRGMFSFESDMEYNGARAPVTGLSPYSEIKSRRNRLQLGCSCDVYQCRSEHSYSNVDKPHRKRCKHFHSCRSSRYLSYQDFRQSSTCSHVHDRVSSSESEVWQQPGRQVRYKRRAYKDRKSQTSYRNKYDSADQDQQRRIERDFSEEEPYKDTLMRSFLSDTYKCKPTEETEPVVETETIVSDTLEHVNTKQELTQSDSAFSRSSILPNTPFEVSDSDKRSGSSVNDIEIIDLESVDPGILCTDDSDNNPTDVIRRLSPLIPLSPMQSIGPQGSFFKKPTKDSAYQTKQSSVDKVAGIVVKDTPLPSQKSTKKTEITNKLDEKIKRHLHQAALKLAMFKRLQAKEQYSKDSAIHTFSEDDLSVDEPESRHIPLVKRTSGSLLAMQNKAMNLSRVAEEMCLSRETNTPTGDNITESVDRHSIDRRSPNIDMQMRDMGTSRPPPSILQDFNTAETIV